VRAELLNLQVTFVLFNRYLWFGAVQRNSLDSARGGHNIAVAEVKKKGAEALGKLNCRNVPRRGSACRGGTSEHPETHVTDWVGV